VAVGYFWCNIPLEYPGGHSPELVQLSKRILKPKVIFPAVTNVSNAIPRFIHTAANSRNQIGLNVQFSKIASRMQF